MIVLTARQREVFNLVNRGWTSKEIGGKLKLSEVAVKRVIKRIALKLPGPGTPRERIRKCDWPQREAS